MATNAYESAVRTMAILVPELILLLSGDRHDDGSAFVQPAAAAVVPRRGLGAAGRAAWPCSAASGNETDMYASVALNDALSFWARLVLLLTGLIVLGLAHDEPSDDRAGEFFGCPADDRTRARCSSPPPTSWCSCSSGWSW